MRNFNNYIFRFKQDEAHPSIEALFWQKLFGHFDSNFLCTFPSSVTCTISWEIFHQNIWIGHFSFFAIWNLYYGIQTYSEHLYNTNHEENTLKFSISITVLKILITYKIQLYADHRVVVRLRNSSNDWMGKVQSFRWSWS